MTRVVYSSPYVPPEWIDACGLTPSRLVSRQARPSAPDGPDGPVTLREGVCSFMRSMAAELCASTDATGIVLTTTCDQMRRASEALDGKSVAPVFLLNVPAAARNPSSHRLYAEELRRLGRFLQRIGGRKPSPGRLADVMAEWDARRSRLLSLRGAMDGKAFSLAIAEFNRTFALPDEESSSGQFEVGSAAPVALLGGPMTERDFVLFDLISQAGGRVVLDGAETGERTLPHSFDRRRLREDSFGELTDAYFGNMPDIFRRPNSALYEWLNREIIARGVRGVILVRYVWCDGWHAEVQRLREWLQVPLLDIDLDVELPVKRCATRITAFLETLA